MAFVSVVSLARADVLVNTFSNIDDGYGSWPLVIASTQFIARPFNVTGTYQLSEIDVPLQMNHNATFLVTVRRDDNGGVPGSVVESISVFSPIVVEREIHHLAAHSILTTGSYFIMVEPADATSAGGGTSSMMAVSIRCFGGPRLAALAGVKMLKRIWRWRFTLIPFRNRSPGSRWA